MNPAVGVDLGTTNTVVAVQTDATGPRTLDILQPVDERNVLEPRDHIKSAVYFESSETAVVGAFAARRLDAFRSIKSQMGTRWRMPHPFRTDLRVTPAYISAHILKLAFDELLRQFPSWDHTALVTVPASFNTDQRSDTLRAATLAGFQDVRLLDEPTAAFYYFFDQNRNSYGRSNRQTVLVFDFGGGTLDVSIIRVESAGEHLEIDAIGRSRYNNLGGDDIDTELAAFLLALWEQKEGCVVEEVSTPERLMLFQLFLQRASSYKEEAEYYLASGQTINEFVVNEELLVSGKRRVIKLQRQLTRSQYEDVSGRFFLDKGDLNIFRPIGQALDVAGSIVPGFRKDHVDLVLYTGGASRMGGVRAALETYFAPKPGYSISDEEACNTVALGAASCRWDQQQSRRGVKMTSRLLESILTRDDDAGVYVPVVPLTCEPSVQFRPVSADFRVRRPAIILRLPLFRGVGPLDHHLMPMQDLVLPLPNVVAAGLPYLLSYRMTENKTVQLRASFRSDGGAAFEGDSELEILQDGSDERGMRLPLARIN
ncbi:MAG: Hsp70 family protein [Planctomycetota bacterium]